MAQHPPSASGVLLYTVSRQLLYINQPALELNERLNQGRIRRPAKGVLASDILGLCEEVVASLQRLPTPKDWEHAALTRVCGDPRRPVLLRGIGIMQNGSLEKALVLLLMEELDPGQTAQSVARIQGRFHLTRLSRNQTGSLVLSIRQW